MDRQEEELVSQLRIEANGLRADNERLLDESARVNKHLGLMGKVFDAARVACNWVIDDADDEILDDLESALNEAGSFDALHDAKGNPINPLPRSTVDKLSPVHEDLFWAIADSLDRELTDAEKTVAATFIDQPVRCDRERDIESDEREMQFEEDEL
tara:strand:+ start:440 stop:907 length:468 start_codon:yes stop_codon:yes gene_type:complete